MAGLLEGKVAIITGAGGGLGEAYAKLFAKEGASVVVNDLGGSRDGTGTGTSAAAEKVVTEIKAAGGKAVANGDDVSTVQGGENILQTALDSFGKVDILVCNAGILRDKTFANTSEDDWDKVIKVHLKGTYCCALPVWKYMKDHGGGSMVLTSSTSGLYGNFGQTNYGAAKAGIYGMVRVMSIEGRKYNIRVMGLAPGAYTCRKTSRRACCSWSPTSPPSTPARSWASPAGASAKSRCCRRPASSPAGPTPRKRSPSTRRRCSSPTPRSGRPRRPKGRAQALRIQSPRPRRLTVETGAGSDPWQRLTVRWRV
jgi:NAD(P)-dependent dehydrogenase (short-subunit alcohol dehydrogenase family)